MRVVLEGLLYDTETATQVVRVGYDYYEKLPTRIVTLYQTNKGTFFTCDGTGIAVREQEVHECIWKVLTKEGTLRWCDKHGIAREGVLPYVAPETPEG